MNYIIANKSLASTRGFSPDRHKTNGALILLNEKEVMSSSSLTGDTLAEKIKEIQGEVYSHSQIKYLINEGGWNE